MTKQAESVPQLMSKTALMFAMAALALIAAYSQASANIDSLDDYLDGVIRAQIEVQQTPGIGVSLVSLDGGTINRAVGYAELVESNPLDAENWAFPIASISKVLVAVSLLRAQDMGLLDLEDAANLHLDFELPQFPASREIRLRDLARHEAGFEERWLATGAGTSPDPRPWGEILASTYPGLIAPPGSYASYSNYGIALLGYIIERASGQPYHEFLKKQVTEPLGMEDTFIPGMGPRPDVRVAEGSLLRAGVAQSPVETFNKRTHPAGRVVSTLSDMSKLMYMLLGGGIGRNGNRILSVTAMSELFDTKSVHPKMPGMGVVLAQKDIGAKRFIGHGGDGSSIHTDMILSPDDGVGIFVVFLSAPGPQVRDSFHRAIIPRLFPESDFAPLPLPDSGVSPDLSGFTGEFRHYRWSFSSIERLLQLISEFRVIDSGRGTLIVDGRLSAGEYVPTSDEKLWRNRLTGEYMSFSRGWDGALLLNTGNFPFMTAYRLDWLDTQRTNRRAYRLFTWGFGILSLVLAFLAVRAYVSGQPRASLGHGLLSICGAISAFGTYAAVNIALSLSEPELQKAIPAIASWVLALPFAAAAAVITYLWVFVTRYSRPTGWLESTIQAGMLVLFVAYLYYLNHWNALGWNYP